MTSDKNVTKIFTLNGERFTTNESGELVPFVEEIKQKEDAVQIANTVNETCAILRLGRNTVMSLINSGKLKAVKTGLKWLVPGWAIKEFLQYPK